MLLLTLLPFSFKYILAEWSLRLLTFSRVTGEVSGFCCIIDFSLCTDNVSAALNNGRRFDRRLMKMFFFNLSACIGLIR